MDYGEDPKGDNNGRENILRRKGKVFANESKYS